MKLLAKGVQFEQLQYETPERFNFPLPGGLVVIASAAVATTSVARTTALMFKSSAQPL
jgi:hypothetical protein